VLACHRVVGKGGALTGYAGGLRRKRFLLDLERGATRVLGDEATPMAEGRLAVKSPPTARAQRWARCGDFTVS